MLSKKNKLIAVTGGIGSGKSTVCKCLRAFGFKVLEADALGHWLLDNSISIKNALTANFGSIYNENKANRKLLAQIVFSDKNKLRLLNQIFKEHFKTSIAQWADYYSNEQILFVEFAVLFEYGLEVFFDKIVLVYSPKEIRIQRLLKTTSLTEEEVIQRINSQIEQEKLKERCDYMILNDNKTAVIPQIKQILSDLL